MTMRQQKMAVKGTELGTAYGFSCNVSHQSIAQNIESGTVHLDVYLPFISRMSLQVS